MTMPSEVRRELFDLLWSLNAGPCSPTDVERLERLTQRYSEAREFYAQFTMMCGVLRWDRALLLPPERGQGCSATETAGLQKARDADWRASDDQQRPDPESGIPGSDGNVSSVPSSPWILHPLAIFPAFGGAILCYTIAAALMGAGALAAWMWETSSGFRSTGGNPALASAAPTRPVKHTRIGRITAMVGCRWAHPDSLEKDLSEGHLELTAGLLEIAHDGGARVILEGPVKYTAESSTVGSLHYGKLTARAGQIERERSPAGPHHPSFVIQTPGVVATNLVLVDGGAEFGVAVEPAEVYGTTLAHVFRGRVVLEVPEIGSRGSSALSEGQSARLVVSVNQQTQVIEQDIRRDGGPEAAFVRQLPQPPLIYSVAEAAVIARVTRSVGCRWSNPENADANAVVGRFALEAGWLEITYNTGTKVRLEGPVKYAVTAPNRGLLAAGKISVATGADTGRGRSAPRPAGADHAPFSVETADTPNPATVVAECGAQFRMVLDQSGMLVAENLRGKVRVDVARLSALDAICPLPEGRSLMVGPTGGGASGVFRNWEDGPPDVARRLLNGAPICAAEVNGEEGLRLKDGRKSKRPNS